MPVIQRNGKWFRIAIEEVWSYGIDDRRMGFAAAGMDAPEASKKMRRINKAFMGTWEQIGGGAPAEVHLIDVGFERDWQPIYDAIAKAEPGE